MTRPQRYLVRMIFFLVAFAAVAALLYAPLKGAFLANSVFNGMILGVLLLGIVYIFRQVLLLYPEVAWIERFRRSQPGASTQAPPRLLGPMATMLGEREGRVSLSALSLRSLLDSISSRLDESRDISRYMIGLLIYLGLLGTFWGLLQTVASTAGGIAMLRESAGVGGDLGILVNDFLRGLEGPLEGMGTAFSSSLFGLAGSLVLGFFDLQAGQAQNRFYNDLEEWLSGLTRLSSGPLVAEGDQPVPAYIQALLEQTADGLENLQRTLARGEESRIAVDGNLAVLTERLAALTDQMRTEQSLMAKLAENQTDLKSVLSRLADVASQGGLGLDESTRTHIRNLDVYMTRLFEELSQGRTQAVQDIRSEIKLLARTIAASAEQKQR
ncbi:MAG: flagellar motor protein MotA [Proteobacteria bacterium]|nr:flagellar motor protein MotA [Pseudomonadota bacterium]